MATSSDLAPARVALEPAAFSRALRRSATAVGLVVLPLFLLGLFLTSRGYAFDFEAFWQAGKAVRAGQSPYPDPHTVDFAGALAATSSYENHFEFVYPAPALVSFVPLSLLPFDVAAGIFTALGIAAIVASLHLLGGCIQPDTVDSSSA